MDAELQRECARTNASWNRESASSSNVRLKKHFSVFAMKCVGQKVCVETELVNFTTVACPKHGQGCSLEKPQQTY